jgi:hypothetical protein
MKRTDLLSRLYELFEPQKGEKVLVCSHVGDETRMFEVIPDTSLYPKMIICSECKEENEGADIDLTVVIWGEQGEGFKEVTIQ